MIRDLSIKDLVELEEHAQFPLINLRCQPKLIEKSIEDEKGLLASIIVTNTAEISIIFADRDKKDKVRGLRQIEQLVVDELLGKGFRDAHIFITDPEYAKILVKHFGFEHVVGQALVRRARNGKKPDKSSY
jgi:nickel-dependent lactate racemase